MTLRGKDEGGTRASFQRLDRHWQGVVEDLSVPGGWHHRGVVGVFMVHVRVGQRGRGRGHSTKLWVYVAIAIIGLPNVWQWGGAVRAWPKPVTPILVQWTWVWWEWSTANLTLKVGTPPTAVRVGGGGWE